MAHNTPNSRGSVVITIILFMIILMTSAAVVLSGTLSRHIRASRDYLASERAFSGANSGIEDMLYQLRKQGKIEDITVEGTIGYEDESDVTYKGSGKGIQGDTGITPCMTSAGASASLVRRIEVGGGAEGCDL